MKKTFKEKLTYLETPLFPIFLLLKAGLIATLDEPLFTEAGGFQSRYNLAHCPNASQRWGLGGQRGPELSPHVAHKATLRGGLHLPRRKRRLILCSEARRWSQRHPCTPQLIRGRPAVNGAQTQTRPWAVMRSWGCSLMTAWLPLWADTPSLFTHALTRRPPSPVQEESSHQTSILPSPSSQTSSLRNCENSLCA